MDSMWYLLVFTASVFGADAAAFAAALNPTERMSSVDYSNVPFVEKALPTVGLGEIVPVLSRGLLQTFEEVNVSVVDTPDLTLPPYNLAAPGLNGDVKLVEIGGPPYLVPLVKRDKIYDLKVLLQHLGRDPGFLVGAGAGPWPHIGVNCEGIINLLVSNGSVEQGTRIVSVEPVGAAKGDSGYLQRRLPSDETRTALLGNYLLSDGKPGKDLDLRVQHFHGWGSGSGGHYHYDTTPDTVEYEGYFVLASSIIRVDAPTDTHHVGRD